MSHNRQISFTEVLKQKGTHDPHQNIPNHDPQNVCQPYPKNNIIKANGHKRVQSRPITQNKNMLQSESDYDQTNENKFHYTQVESKYSYDRPHQNPNVNNHKNVKNTNQNQNKRRGLMNQQSSYEEVTSVISKMSLFELMEQYENNPDNEYTLTFKSNSISNRNRNIHANGIVNKGAFFDDWIQKQAQKENRHVNEHEQNYYENSQEYYGNPRNQLYKGNQNYHPKQISTAREPARNGDRGYNSDAKRVNQGMAFQGQRNIIQESSSNESEAYQGYANSENRQRGHSQKAGQNINKRSFQKALFTSEDSQQLALYSQPEGMGDSTGSDIIETLVRQQLSDIEQFTPEENRILKERFEKLKSEKLIQCDQVCRQNPDPVTKKNWILDIKQNFIKEIEYLAQDMIKNRGSVQRGQYYASEIQENSRYQQAKDQITQYLKMKTSSTSQKRSQQIPENRIAPQQRLASENQEENEMGVGYSFATEFQMAKQLSQHQELINNKNEEDDRNIERENQQNKFMDGYNVPNVHSVESESQIPESIKRDEASDAENIDKANNNDLKIPVPEVESIMGGDFLKRENSSKNLIEQEKSSQGSDQIQKSTSSNSNDVRIVESKLVFNPQQSGNGISLKSFKNQNDANNAAKQEQTKAQGSSNQYHQTVVHQISSPTNGGRVVYDGLLEFKKRYPSLNTVNHVQPVNKGTSNQTQNHVVNEKTDEKQIKETLNHQQAVPSNRESSYKRQPYQAQYAVSNNLIPNQNQAQVQSKTPTPQPCSNSSVKFDNLFAKELENQNGREARNSISQKPNNPIPMIKQSKGGIRNSLVKNTPGQTQPAKKIDLFNQPMVTSIRLNNKQSPGVQKMKDSKADQSQSINIQLELNISDA